MDELDVLGDVTSRLEGAGVAYMLTGSLATSYHAQPRMTRDIDLVVELSEEDTQRIIDAFRPGYYLSEGAVRDAIRDRSLFELIHIESVTKVGFLVRRDEPYRLAEFERRREVRLGGLTIWLVSKEDLIISKIAWARDSRSELQRRDVLSLLASGYDREYVDRWLRRLGHAGFAAEWLA